MIRVQKGNDLGEGAHVQSSIIGNNVSIGRNVKVLESCVGDNVVIEEGARIGPKSIIAKNVGFDMANLILALYFFTFF